MAKTGDNMTLRLIGAQADGGLVRLDEFAEFCKSVQQMLKETERCISGKPPSLRFRVADLKCESAQITVDARKPSRGHDSRNEVFKTAKTTLKNLESGKKPDSRLDAKALNAYRNIGRPLLKSAGRSVEQKRTIHVDGIELTISFVATLDKLSEPTIRSVGSVSGCLEKLNRHNCSEFIIFPPIGDHQVICQFPDRLLPKVCDAIKNRSTVTVFGKLQYSESKPFPLRAEVEEIDIHPPASELPLLSSMAGVLGSKTLKTDSVSAVRMIRDE